MLSLSFLACCLCWAGVIYQAYQSVFTCQLVESNSVVAAAGN